MAARVGKTYDFFCICYPSFLLAATIVVEIGGVQCVVRSSAPCRGSGSTCTSPSLVTEKIFPNRFGSGEIFRQTDRRVPDRYYMAGLRLSQSMWGLASDRFPTCQRPTLAHVAPGVYSCGDGSRNVLTRGRWSPRRYSQSWSEEDLHIADENGLSAHDSVATGRCRQSVATTLLRATMIHDVSCCAR